MPLLPLFIWTLTAAPTVRPWSASRLPVETLTSWIASSPGTYAETCGSHTLVAVAPSIRMLFEFREVPLALKVRACSSRRVLLPGPGADQRDAARSRPRVWFDSDHIGPIDSAMP